MTESEADQDRCPACGPIDRSRIAHNNLVHRNITIPNGRPL